MKSVDEIDRFTLWQYRMVSRFTHRRYTLAEMRWRTAELWLALIMLVGLFVSTVLPEVLKGL
jgi:hypothetical protein